MTDDAPSGRHKADPSEALRDSEPDATTPEEETSSRNLPFWLEMGVLLVVALVLAVGIKALFMQAFYIPSGSMNDTLVFNDRILVQKVSYWRGEPQRGDIVVFADPGGWLDGNAGPQPRNLLAKGLEKVGLFPTGGHLVKRVIAVGGDTVRCCDKRGRVRVNNTVLDEGDYLATGVKPSLITFKQRIPEGYLWVMGDNRSESADSRVHLGDPGGGCVPVDNVVGKVFTVVWPIGHAKLIKRPDTFEAVPSGTARPDSCGG